MVVVAAPGLPSAPSQNSVPKLGNVFARASDFSGSANPPGRVVAISDFGPAGGPEPGVLSNRSRLVA